MGLSRNSRPSKASLISREPGLHELYSDFFLSEPHRGRSAPQNESTVRRQSEPRIQQTAPKCHRCRRENRLKRIVVAWSLDKTRLFRTPRKLSNSQEQYLSFGWNIILSCIVWSMFAVSPRFVCLALFDYVFNVFTKWLALAEWIQVHWILHMFCAFLIEDSTHLRHLVACN